MIKAVILSIPQFQIFFTSYNKLIFKLFRHYANEGNAVCDRNRNSVDATVSKIPYNKLIFGLSDTMLTRERQSYDRSSKSLDTVVPDYQTTSRPTTTVPESKRPVNMKVIESANLGPKIFIEIPCVCSFFCLVFVT